METIKIITLVVGAAALTAAAGCNIDAHRRQSAERNFERKMDQVRMEQARQSMAEGRYEYARRVLEPALESAQRGHEARTLMHQIQAADQVYTQMAEFRRDDDQGERVY